MPRSAGTRSPLLFVSALVIGALLAVAAVDLRRGPTSLAQSRSTLVSQVQARQAEADSRAREVARLRTEVESLQAGALKRKASSDAVALGALETQAASTAMTGPGVTVTVDDAPGAAVSADGNPRSGSGDSGRVLSRDVAILVNGLWVAGAQGIAVNGQRLSSRTAIRFAGDAILVNYRPLSPPYRIVAVGDTDAVTKGFMTGPGGSYLASLKDNFGIVGSVKGASRVTIPAAPVVALRHATPQEASP